MATVRNRIAYAGGSFVAAVCISMMLSHDYEQWRAPGPANAGHEELGCNDCHRRAEGTLRQQLQANARYWIGLRDEPVDFGLKGVTSVDCSDCHRRPADRHPIYRFVEPRFAAARAAIAPQHCTSCHLEHTGKSVTIESTFCRHCHKNLSIPGDRTDPPHRAIVQTEAWNTCLRCHDFHGNHEGDPPRSLSEPSRRLGTKRYAARSRRSS
jgi:hypothetical protein